MSFAKCLKTFFLQKHLQVTASGLYFWKCTCNTMAMVFRYLPSFSIVYPNNMLKILIMKIKFCQGSTFHVVPKKQVKNLCWSKRQSKNFMHASTMCSLNKVQYSFDIIIGLNVLCKVPLSLFRTPAI